VESLRPAKAGLNDFIFLEAESKKLKAKSFLGSTSQ
jgi:hypothetical protein